MDSLEALLHSLSRQTYRDFCIIVVENDEDNASELLCRELAKRLHLPIHYFHQPHGGIPHTRNRALDELPSDIAWVALIDDDEQAEVLWLERLLHQAHTSGVDIATGPVEPVLPLGVPQWLREGGFFHRPRYPSGTMVTRARSGNALIRRVLLDHLRFDERMAATGGSDTQLFSQLFQSGARCVWADDAVVHEMVTSACANEAWLVRRFFRYGNTLAMVDRHNGNSLALRAIKASVVGVLGVGAFLIALSRGRPHRLRARLRIARALGSLGGIVGIFYKAYRTDL